MSWWNAIRSPSHRSQRGSHASHARRPHRRAEPLEARWLLASGAFVEMNLASNQPGGALVADPSLVSAWGIATSPGASDGFSVSDPLGQRSNSYGGDVAGSPFAQNAGQTVNVPFATGQVYNGNANEFIVHSPNPPPGGTTPIAGGPAEFLYASLDGSIYGFNAHIGQQAVAAVSVPGAAFTGLALASAATAGSGATDQLYAADFSGGKIDVFNTSFQPVTTSGSFTDPNLPAGFKPFNIQALGGELYVSYAARPVLPPWGSGGDPLVPIPGPSGGVVDVFDDNGNFTRRIASGSPLDVPWGMALAPPSFGQFAGDLLVGNHGDGKINVFDPATGKSLGALGGADGNPFVVRGLWGLSFGNGDNAGDTGALYFAAGPEFSGPPEPLASLANASSVDPPTILPFPIPTFLHGLFGTVQVTGASPLVAVGTNATAYTGKEFSGALAAFGSADLPSPTALPAADYTATIDWGDGGSTTAGSVVPTGNGGFLVVGSHTYTTEATDHYQVTIQDASGNSAMASGEVNVTTAPLSAHGLPVISQGLSVNGAVVAAFTDLGGTDAILNYSATINWGDGTSTTGTIGSFYAVIDPPPVADGYFTVAGSHTYAATGDYTLTVTITDTDGSQATAQSTAHVAQATLLADGLPVESQGLTVNAAAVATFVDTGGADPTTDYSATINWGDGTSASAGTIVPLLVPVGGLTAPGGYFSVTGDHTYTSTGDYTLTVTITDTDGSQATAQSTAHVAQATLLAHGLPVESQGLTVNAAAVATFVDTSGADPTTDYSATINWGDGTSASAGTIVPLLVPVGGLTAPGGYFSVTGDHTYTSTGDYTLTVTITDTDGSQATAQSTAHMAQAPLLATGVPVVVSKGFTVNGAIVAAFADAGGGDPAANYAATIDWGDGGSTTTAGTVGGTGNSFIVTASHTYTTASVYDVKIAITDQDGSTAHVDTHAYVSAPAASFVANAFQNVLHRPVDDAGLSYWNQQIQNGVSPAQFAADLTHSSEFYATNVIDPVYQKYLGRAPDAGGVAYWTTQMQQGLTDQQIEAGFIASTEFYAHAGGTNAAWVNAMYQGVLGRPADSGGLSYWTAQLSAGASRPSVATGFAASQEREAQIVQDDYFTYLGRSASPAEVSYWVAQFEHGATNEDIVSRFVGSSEYFKTHS